MKTITLKPSPLTIHFNTRSLPIPLNHSATQCQVHRLCVRLASWPGPHPPWPWPPRRLHQPPMAGRQAGPLGYKGGPSTKTERTAECCTAAFMRGPAICDPIHWKYTVYHFNRVQSQSVKESFFFLQKNKIKQCDFLKVTVLRKIHFCHWFLEVNCVSSVNEFQIYG